MAQWAVTVEAVTPGGQVTSPGLEFMVAALEPYQAAVSSGPDRLGVTMTVEADTASDACVEGAAAVAKLTPTAHEIVRVHARTYGELDLEINYSEELVGVAEVAKMLGRSRQRVIQLAERPEFPRPVAHLANGRVWRRFQVAGYLRHRGRKRAARGTVASPQPIA